MVGNKALKRYIDAYAMRVVCKLFNDDSVEQVALGRAETLLAQTLMILKSRFSGYNMSSYVKYIIERLERAKNDVAKAKLTDDNARLLRDASFMIKSVINSLKKDSRFPLLYKGIGFRVRDMYYNLVRANKIILGLRVKRWIA